MDKITTGSRGEELACQYLRKQGYEIIERNFHIRGGEIDIVAKDGEYLVFVEVKTRYSHEYGLPVESMTLCKMKHLLKTAKFYLQKINWGDGPYRLDFVSIDYAGKDDKIDYADGEGSPRVDLIKNITG